MTEPKPDRPEVSRRGFLRTVVASVTAVTVPGFGKGPELPSQNSEELLTDERLEKLGIKVREFGYEWNLDEDTRKRLTGAEKDGRQQPKLEQLIGPGGRIVGYKVTWYPDNILGANGAKIYITDGSTPIAGQVIGLGWLAQYFDPEIAQTMGSETPPSFTFYVINEYLGLSGANVIPSQVPLEYGQRLVMKSFEGVYKEGKMGGPYFDLRPVKLFEADLPGQQRRQHDQFSDQPKG